MTLSPTYGPTSPLVPAPGQHDMPNNLMLPLPISRYVAYPALPDVETEAAMYPSREQEYSVPHAWLISDAFGVYVT